MFELSDSMVAPYQTIDVLRLVLARDVATPPPLERWDAAAWERVQRTIAAWDARPLAYGAIRAARLAQHVPAGVLATWRKDHTDTTAVNLRLGFEASAIVAALATRGARAIPLKGTALFDLGVWRDPGARPTCDVDLLIDPADGAKVRRALEERGYEGARAGGPKHWPPMVREGLMLEVHEHAFWSLADGHRVRIGEIVDAAGRPAIGGTAAHLLHHLFESSVTTPWLVVKTLADLAEVLAFGDRTGPAVSEEVAEAARRFGLGRRLGALAGALQRVIGREVPETWTREQRAGDVDALLRRCEPRGKALEEALRLPDRAAAFARMPASEKVALLRHHLAPEPEVMRAMYGLPAGSPWVWPLYAVRPVHLVGQGAVDAARLLGGKKPRDRE
jgi:hypothetical protein